jgi:hypothetical protein
MFGIAYRFVDHIERLRHETPFLEELLERTLSGIDAREHHNRKANSAKAFMPDKLRAQYSLMERISKRSI